MTNLPTGTVTFLFTDIEGSTQLWEKYPEAMKAALAKHDAILRTAIEANNGQVFKTVGDAFYTAFNSSPDALQAAIEAQKKLQNEPWGEAQLKVRMALHCGEVESRNNDYFGQPLNRVARLLSAGHGGQVLISQAIKENISAPLPEETTLRDLGERRLKDLVRPQRIYQLVIPKLIQDFSPLNTLDAFRTNLPANLTTFIGREKEIAEIKQELSEHRLVTLIGSGGTGKTRLSLQVAADLLDLFPDGIWFVELASLTDPDLIPSTILSTLGATEQPDKSALKSLEEFLHNKKIFILLDNCEHVVALTAQTANAILNAAPNLRILATSREALGVKGELSWHVPSLSLPNPKKLPDIKQLLEFEAVRLFVERAELTNPAFALDENNASHVAQICYRLDGIPLALELAAARIKILNVDQIAARLDNRFRLLTGGARTSLPRQQTLRAMIDWSYELLSENERLLLRRLAVFAGGWTLELAEQICADEKIDAYEILDMLAKLVDKSLAATLEGAAGMRYRILETIRQYAREKLFESAESEKIRNQHLKFIVELAEKAEPEIRGANQLIWLDRLEEEIDNLRTALEWSQERNPEFCVRLAGALWRFWDMRGYSTDALEWFPISIALSQDNPTIYRARLLSRASMYYRNSSNLKMAHQLAQDAIELAQVLDDKASLALALGIQGEALSLFAENWHIAKQLLDEGLKLCEELGDHWTACSIWYAMGGLALRENDHLLQLSCIQKGLEEARLSKDNRRISRGLGDLSFYYLDHGEFEKAEAFSKEALALAVQIKDKDNVAERSLNLANVYIYLERYTDAQSLFVEARKIFEEIGHSLYLVGAICGLSSLAWIREDMNQFVKLSDEALTIAKELDDYYSLAPAFLFHGSAALFEGKYQLARQELTESIRLCQKMKVNWHYGLGIASFGMLATAEGQLERAAQIFGAYEQLAPSLPAEAPFLLRKAAEHKEMAKKQLSAEQFEEMVDKGSKMSLEQTLDFVLG